MKRDWRSKIARLKARPGSEGHSEELAHRVEPERARNWTIRYLERVRDVIAKDMKIDRAAVSNYRIAQRLEIAPNRLSHYYGHGGSMDNRLAYQVAKILGEEPLIVIAEIEADRAMRDEDRSFWRSVARKVAGVVLPAAMAIGAASFGVTPSPAFASNVQPGSTIPGLCIMLNRRRRLAAWLTAWLAALALLSQGFTGPRTLG